MSFTNPAFVISTRSVFQPAGEAGLWVKQWDPPTLSPATPERLDLTNLPLGVKANPVPDVMFKAGFQNKPSHPFTVQRDLLHSAIIPTWDNRTGGLLFYLFRDKDNPATGKGNYPGAAIRVPRGAVFHCDTLGHGPPPHTIHWHGIEPTSINDGVGHCSMEIANYTYQWQPNHIGTYFMHCHRNTVQHFEFGLLSALIIHPPDAYFATQADPNIPIGAGTDGLFRAAANTAAFPQFPGFNSNPIESGDPHAFTVPYHVEALWVLDDRDSRWSDLAPNARAFFPSHGNQPGVNDKFVSGFFNDYDSDYWFVTGVPVVPLDGVKRTGNVGTIHPADPPPMGGGLPGGVIPPTLNSGVTGTQIAINAKTNDTILIRILCAAYNSIRVTFPVDAVIIAFDGRALGVPPFGNYNSPFLLPKGTPIQICTARRFDALIKSTTAVNDFAMVDFLDSQGVPPPLTQTAKIPIVIS